MGFSNDFSSIFGVTAASQTTVPWPGVSNGLQFLTLTANYYLAIPFTPSGVHSGSFKSQPSAGQINASITISTCPGDFRTTAVPGVLGANCFRSLSGGVNTTVAWDTNPNGTAPGTCHLTPGTPYYLNIIQAPLTDATSPPSTRPVTRCGDGNCQAAINNNFQ